MAVTKTWIVNAGANSRHPQLNGETVPVYTQFSNGLQYPGDPAGSVEDTAGCQCHMVVTGTSSRTDTGVNPEWEERVNSFYDRAPTELLDDLEDGKLLGATRRLRDPTYGDDPAHIARLQRTIKSTDELIEKHGYVFREDEVLYRGVFDDSGWFKPEVGKTWADDGYTFASMSDEIGRGYAPAQAVDHWFIKIVMKEGDRAMPYPRHQAMLLPRSKTYRIVEVDRKKRVVVLLAE